MSFRRELHEAGEDAREKRGKFRLPARVPTRERGGWSWMGFRTRQNKERVSDSKEGEELEQGRDGRGWYAPNVAVVGKSGKVAAWRRWHGHELWGGRELDGADVESVFVSCTCVGSSAAAVAAAAASSALCQSKGFG